MKNLTIRNIPDELLKKIRIRAARQRRSMNSEILRVVEAGLEAQPLSNTAVVSVELRTALWEGLTGQWSGRSAEELIAVIYNERTVSV